MRADKRWVDHSNKIYNNLKCIKYMFSIEGRAQWEVECLLCHRILNMDIGRVKSGHSKSCGCQIHHKKELSESVEIWCKKQIYTKYKHRAKDSDMLFDLTFENFCNILDLPCFYCGDIKTQKFAHHNFPNRILRYNGIDRFDNDKGYIIDNCMPCCIVCNRMKLNMPYYKFFTHIVKIYKNFSRIQSITKLQGD